MVQDETTTAAAFTTVWNYYGSDESTRGMDGSTHSYETTSAHYPTSFRPTTSTPTTPRYATGYPYTTSRNHYELNKTKSYNYTTTPYPHRSTYPYPTPYVPYTTSYNPYMRTPYHYPPTPAYYNPYTTPYHYRPTPAIDPYTAPHQYGNVANSLLISPPKPTTNIITQNFNAPVVYKICVMCRFQNWGHSEDKIDFGKKNETEVSIEGFGKKNVTEGPYEDPQYAANQRYDDHVW